jgi:hypothetical protein
MLEESGAISHDDVGLLDAVIDGATWDANAPSFAATSSLLFDGTNDYLSIAQSDTVWDSAEERSISFWVKSDEIGGVSSPHEFPFIVMLKSDRTDPFSVWLDASGLNFGYYSDFKKVASSYVTFQNNWVNVVITYDGTGATDVSNYVVYVSGVSVAISAGGTWPVTSQVTQIGKGGVPESYFDGRLFDIRIYDKILTASEAYALANGYTNAWVGSQGDGTWEDEDCWPLSGLPTSSDTVIFSGDDTNCTVVSTNQIVLAGLYVDGGYLGTLDLTFCYLTVNGDFNHLGAAIVAYPQVLKVSGDCIVTAVDVIDNIKRTTIELFGDTNANFGLPDNNVEIFGVIVSADSGVTKTLTGTNTHLQTRSLHVSSGILDINDKYITVANDFTVIGGSFVNPSAYVSHTISGNALWYGQSKLNKLDLDFDSIVTFDVSGAFLIRNAIVGNLNDAGTTAKCLNCEEA